MFSKLSPATRALLIANVVVFLLQWLAGESVLGDALEIKDFAHVKKLRIDSTSRGV